MAAATMGESSSPLRLATFNVHGFHDARGSDNTDKIIELVKRFSPDVLCLQEAPKHSSQEVFARLVQEGLFQSANGFAFRNNCAIFSRFGLVQIDCHSNRRRKHWPRYCTCVVKVSDRFSFALTCLHLNHRWEPTRMRELQQILTDHHNCKQLSKEMPRIFTGDFNALTLNDYDSARLDEIALVRKDNNWEQPLGHITAKMGSEGFTDAKALCPRLVGPLSTCRFQSRIDYFFLESSRFDRVLGLTHVDDDASDHNMVIIDV